MEEAVAVRQAALSAVDDVDPDALFDALEQRVEGGSMAPGVLTLLSAAAVDGGYDGVTDRAAGVQLIYEGLRLTRSLAHAEPWSAAAAEGWSPADVAADRPTGNGKSPAAAAADIDILVADIMVARGFYLLARTEAAEAAVGVVRSFGRDQTVRRETDDPSLDDNLEADVFELAVVAGTTAVGGGPAVHLGEFATDLATVESDRDLPDVDALVTDAVVNRLAGLVSTDSTPPEGPRTSADH